MLDMVKCVPAYRREDIEATIAINLARGLPSPDYGTQRGAINICGNGPSLRERYPTSGKVAACNGAWRALHRAGVFVDYIIVHDPTPENASWFDDAPVYAQYLLASRVHPSVFDKLAGRDIRIWHCGDGPEERAVPAGPFIGIAATVGLSAMNLLAGMGFRHFDCWGLDSCYAYDGAHHATPQDWAESEPLPYQVGKRMFLASLWMVGQVQEGLKQIEANRRDYTVEIHDDGLFAEALAHNTLEVVYDLDKAPGSFDFIHAGLNIESYRREHGYTRVKVHCRRGKGKDGFRTNEPIELDHNHKQHMMNYVVRPLQKMFGFQEVDAVGEQAMEFGYSPKPVLQAFSAGTSLPTFQPSVEAELWALKEFPEPPLVITLREIFYWPQRNSNVEAWLEFAKGLQKEGRVIILRDTWKRDEPLDGFETCRDAVIDLHKRFALYRRAKMNFFVMNGPAALCHYTADVPYMTFLKDAPGYPCYDPKFLQDFIGIEPYGQFPWTSDRQRLVYADDTCENIAKAWNELQQSAGSIAA